MKRWLATALVTLLVLAGPLQADVDEPNDPAYRFYEAQAKKILKAAGDQVWEAAEHAKRNSLFQYAYQQAERALRFDPNQKDARDYLCYTRKGKKWVLDEEAHGKLSRTNTASGKNGRPAPPGTIEKRIEKWKAERLAKADKYVANKYVKLGDVCAKKGFPLQARKGYEAALRLDKDNKRARTALGYKRFGKVWLTQKQEAATKKAAKGKEVKGKSDWDQLFGTTLNKAESGHFSIESTIPVAEILEILKAVETEYAYYLADFGMDPTEDVFGKLARICHMDDGEQWKAWVEKHNPGDTGFTLKLGGTGPRSMLLYGHRMKKGGSSPQLRKDSSLHTAGHMLNTKVWGNGIRAWVDEGLAYYYSLKVQQTCMTHCVGKRAKSKYGKKTIEGGLKEWKDPDNWKPNIKLLVANKDDMPLRTLMMQPITRLEFDATVKAWSFIDWLMEKDRDRFIEYLTRMKGSGSDQETILQDLYKTGIEEIDDDWKRYVLRNY